MARKGWEKMVEKSGLGREPEIAVANRKAVDLLARQHASFVRLVKKAQAYGPNFRGGMVKCDKGEWISKADILAALKEMK